MRRIEGRTRTRKEPLNEIQKDISALEILNDICKLLREVRIRRRQSVRTLTRTAFSPGTTSE